MVDGLNCPPLIPETVDGKTNNANVFGKKNKPKPIAICNNSCQLTDSQLSCTAQKAEEEFCHFELAFFLKLPEMYPFAESGWQE